MKLAKNPLVLVRRNYPMRSTGLQTGKISTVNRRRIEAVLRFRRNERAATKFQLGHSHIRGVTTWEVIALAAFAAWFFGSGAAAQCF